MDLSMRESSRLVPAVALGLVLAACGATSSTDAGTGGGGGSGGASNNGSGAIGQAGGTVSLPGGPALSFPPGALSTTATITIAPSKLTAPPSALAGVHDFGPEGATFASRVRVSFPVPNGTSAADVSLYWTKAGDRSQWETRPVTIASTGTGMVATGEVEHFSAGFIGAACTTGQSCRSSNPCHYGAMSCSAGWPRCDDTPKPVPDGIDCGGGATCQAGTCRAASTSCRSYRTLSTIWHTAAAGPVAVGDFNGDGKADVAVVSLWATAGGPANTISVYYGDGTGTTFTPGPTAKTGDYPHQLEVAANLPGFAAGTQFVVSNANPVDSGFSVFDASLATRRDFRSLPYGDSRALVVRQPTFTLGSDTVFASTYVVEARFYEGILQNRSLDDLVAIPPPAKVRGNSTPLCAFPTDMASADFDRDGFADVLVACPNENAVRLYPFASTLTVGYLGYRSFATPAGPGNVAVGDGGRLFASSNGAGSVSLFVGDATWNSPTTSRPYTRSDFATLGTPGGVVFADLDGDGALDMAVGNADGIGIFYGDGVQPREPRVDVPVRGATFAGTVADVDGDGALELLLQTENRIVILKNGCSGPR